MNILEDFKYIASLIINSHHNYQIIFKPWRKWL